MWTRLATPALASLITTTCAVGAAAQAPICNQDASCAYPETCGTCPAECGSCDVAALGAQRAKFVDGSCANGGDGLSDTCAAGPGQAGRFNDLQVALDSLVAGDTLHVHPGDYFRTGDAFRVQGIGTAAAPIVITAADPSVPPVLHSWDPAAPTNNGAAHAALTGAEQAIAHIIVDGLAIDGMLGLHGEHMRVQNVSCTHGWGQCDGNWSCIRLEGCDDCVAHHNFVHDVADTTGLCDGSGSPPRESGLKEFSCNRTVWEHNTVINTVRWGYDLHRSSFDTTVRFNLFQNTGTDVSLRMNRTGNQSAYGNVVVGGGICIQLVSEDAGDGFTNVVDHNTCLHTTAGIYLSPHAPTTVTNNVMGFLGPGSADLVNIALPPAEDGVPHEADHNAYDANSRWVTELYNAPYAMTLAEWQTSTSYDANSITDPCTYVDAPEDADDRTFDASIEAGSCATLSDTGGPAGACAIATCVGSDCEACGDAPVDDGSGGGGSGGDDGVGGDGGTSHVPDGGGGSAATADPAPSDSGCACNMHQRQRGSMHGLWLLAALALRRRRRR